MTSGEYGELGSYPPPGGQEPGGVVVRVGARVVDGIVVNIVAVLLALAAGSLSSYWVTGLFSGLLMFLYFLVFEAAQGWTLGKKLLGLRVHGPGGSPKPDFQQSAVRNVWTLLPIIPIIGGFLLFVAIVVIILTANSSPTKQGKHDELAGGTQVVKG
ncbi:putative RDD family membrane protein YckC [Mycobacterium sp. OAS707]|uniref:RDD family protein n=1 Tax=Mycobacterium sp. OAS707 TaxID=2663822 RepID=UPI00178A0713|nr:RDD family protein [Mycobacterium sp. OAS707]MBE1548625.1 putative RDD family membrane protein YckC [Mycobacterium sp. OAS707]